MGRTLFGLSRVAAGGAAGIVMAAAGVGIAEAGATGSSDQYTKGAKPYAGVTPQRSAAANTALKSTNAETAAWVKAAVRGSADVTSPYTTTAQQLAAAEAALTAQSAELLVFIKDDLRKVLAPTGNYLKVATLAKAKTIGFAFTSLGSGKITVQWKAGLVGQKGVYYVNYTGSFKKVADTTLKLPTTAAGRTLLAKAGKKKVNVVAVVTYTTTTGAAIKVSRSYSLTS